MINKQLQPIKDFTNSEIVSKIQEYLVELEDYKPLSIEQQKNDIDFGILIKTKIKNFIYDSPLLKKAYEERTFYFENLANDDNFIILLNKINLIKKKLLDLINVKALNDWNTKRQNDYLTNLDKEIIEAFELNKVKEPREIKDLLIQLKNPETKENFDKIKRELICLIQENIGYNQGLKDHIENSSEFIFYLNWQVRGILSLDDGPFKAEEAIDFCRSRDYANYNPETEKNILVKLTENNTNVPSSGIRWMLSEFIYFINVLKTKECLINIEIAENLIKDYKSCIEELTSFIYKIPQNFYFKYFDDLNDAFIGFSIINSNYKAAKEVLKELKNTIKISNEGLPQATLKKENEIINLKEILPTEEFNAVNAYKEHKSMKGAAKALIKEETTIKKQLESARNKVKTALNSEDKITTNELTKMI